MCTLPDAHEPVITNTSARHTTLTFSEILKVAILRRVGIVEQVLEALQSYLDVFDLRRDFTGEFENKQGRENESETRMKQFSSTKLLGITAYSLVGYLLPRYRTSQSWKLRLTLLGVCLVLYWSKVALGKITLIRLDIYVTVKAAFVRLETLLEGFTPFRDVFRSGYICSASHRK